MKLSKENVCVFIENEAHLQQVREILERYEYCHKNITGIVDPLVNARNENKYNHVGFNGYEWTIFSNGIIKKQKITLNELEQILKEEYESK